MQQVSDITIIVGPPGPEDEQQKIEKWSEGSGKSKEEIWVEYVHELLSEFSMRESPELQSTLDELMSFVLKLPVQVNDPVMTSTYISHF